MKYRNRSQDPYWLVLRYPGKCAHCEDDIPAGSRAFRYKTGELYCSAEDCGQAESREFRAAVQDEEAYHAH